MISYFSLAEGQRSRKERDIVFGLRESENLDTKHY